MAHPDITKQMFDSIIARAGRQRIELYKSKDPIPLQSTRWILLINRLKDSAAIKHLNILAVKAPEAIPRVKTPGGYYRNEAKPVKRHDVRKKH